MTYYEELGVARSASVDEIRRAYKKLARVLHPDRHHDPHLRHLAELQMKRLNTVVAVLTDPQLRREYDATLDVRPAPRRLLPGPVWRGAELRARLRPAWAIRASRQTWVWLGAAATVITAMVIFFGQETGEGPGLAAPAAPQVPAAAHPRNSRRRAERLPDNPPRRGQEQARLRPARVLAAVAPPAIAVLRDPGRNLTGQPRPEAMAGGITAKRDAVTQPAPVRSAGATRPGDSRFAGTWVYVPTGALSKGEKLYPPEYIEMQLTEQDGKLHGTYVGRYRVTDQSIPPSVHFEMQGTAETPRARLHWAGSGGATGQITLELISDTAMKVVWSTEQLGGELRLVSGTATLVRWREP